MIHKYCTDSSVTAFSTDRNGGVSKGAYASFNANHYCGDNPQDVEANRSLLCAELGIGGTHLIVPHQTHDTRTLIVNENYFQMPEDIRKSVLEGVDAVCTDLKGVCVCVSTADCIPVLIHDTVRGVVSAVHAGWRGTVRRIVEENISVLQKKYGTVPSDCSAIIGPGISLDAFEIGDEVYDSFSEAGFDMTKIAKRYPSPGAQQEKWHIDLPLCNKLQLIGSGLREENITLSGICTFSNPDTFFSARRLGIKSGRILNGIMLNS